MTQFVDSPRSENGFWRGALRQHGKSGVETQVLGVVGPRTGEQIENEMISAPVPMRKVPKPCLCVADILIREDIPEIINRFRELASNVCPAMCILTTCLTSHVYFRSVTLDSRDAILTCRACLRWARISKLRRGSACRTSNVL